MTDLTVANTILQQLGGNRFRAMTGAKDFVGGDNTLTMTLPASLTTGRINKLRITLTPADLYLVETFKWSPRKLELKAVDSEDGIYAEDLARVFTALTGLDTHL